MNIGGLRVQVEAKMLAAVKAVPVFFEQSNDDTFILNWLEVDNISIEAMLWPDFSYLPQIIC